MKLIIVAIITSTLCFFAGYIYAANAIQEQINNYSCVRIK